MVAVLVVILIYLLGCEGADQYDNHHKNKRIEQDRTTTKCYVLE